ncbi:MAG: NAD-glutamate dehydrogenase [Gammaproteobacteria bacterium]|nr:NAD-glutamate dehydrogenase [Gammaproteobacteria bacterium]
MRTLTDKKDHAIALVCEQIGKQQKQANCEIMQQLAWLYYGESIPSELLQFDTDNLYGALSSLWDCVKLRQGNDVNIRVYNPNYEQHQWYTSHTIIDIVCDDKAFLVSSITNALVHLGHTIHITTHPVVAIERDNKGKATNITPFTGKADSANLEAIMRFEIDQQNDAEVIANIISTLKNIISDVRLVVDDWQPMHDKLVSIIAAMEAQSLPVDAEDFAENIAFLRWVSNNHFTFIGYRSYRLKKDAKSGLCELTPQQGTGLGSFRDENCSPESLLPTTLSQHNTDLALSNDMLVMTKSTSRSTVHRPVNFDYLGLKRFDSKGNVVGEERFFGLYSSAAYTARIDEIPLLRRKAQDLRERIELLPNSHKGKALQHILNHYPRDEMLQASVDELYPIIRGVLETQERHNLRLFLRLDTFGRFATALVYVPRERFNTQLRMKMQDILMREFDGTSVDFNVMFSEQPLARVQLTVHGKDIHSTPFDIDDIEQQMRDGMLAWSDHLHHALNSKQGEAQGNKLFKQYGHAFPVAYQENFSAQVAVMDLMRLQKIGPEKTLSTYLYRSLHQDDQGLSFKVFGHGQAKALSDVLPILERMGVKVINAHPYTIKSDSGLNQWIIDFVIEIDPLVNLDGANVKERFQEAFSQIYTGRVSNDRFNSLVLAANLTWQQVILIRAISSYLHQIQVPFSTTYMQSTLMRNASITHTLVRLFEARFDPNNPQSVNVVGRLQEDISLALEQVSSLDEDRIVKYFLATIMAMLRTNYYQTDSDGNQHQYLSCKLDPSLIPGVPLPLPKYEIFVYSTWVEGVHLRGGKVARGGLRWSDRKEDYRTEVLGLVKAQMVKNAVIVPLGAKGGFVCKQLPQTQDREVLMAEVIRSYSTFIQALLDLTDNMVEKQVVAPEQVVRYDDDDPYLVVAADKGTATFSDLANSISEKNNFWLGDAFASGGANGYDHKKMGITARGAWESVKRLFVEQGRDCQSQDFTVVGVGDMAGDVFGNGMLLSKHICLQAAFNHMHIFIDPTPNSAKSFVERQRLFNLPRSSWSDYESKLISKGGGLFERSAKSIQLTSQMQNMLDTDVTQMTPNELIHALLKMPVDLFWNGGIGTYVKASSESHSDIGDPANDNLRVNGNELGAKVVGEGGNLGFSQHGRIEFAHAGGYINTDAIDNSAGVDSSDHEVNIKILLSQLVDAGDMTVKQRNTLLASMTDEVGDLVLSHNYHQSLVLSIAQSQACARLSDHKRLIHSLEKQGRLNRALEGLPDDANMDERARVQAGLTRPEIAVLLAYSKMRLFDELMAADIGSDAYLAQSLEDYFPKVLTQKYASAMDTHPLRNEIIATHVTNQIGNRMGSTFCNYLQEEVGAEAGDMARALTAACDIINAKNLWHELDRVTLSLDYKQALELHTDIQTLLEDLTLWLLSRHPGASIQAMVDLYQGPMEEYCIQLPKLLPAAAAARVTSQSKILAAQGITTDVSVRLSQLDFLYHGLDIAQVASLCGTKVKTSAQTWYQLYERFQGDWLNQAIANLPSQDPWQRKARASLKQEFEASLAQLTQAVISSDQSQAWNLRNQDLIERCLSLFGELQSNTNINLAMLSVAVREIAKLKTSCA